jgi:flagellar basal-body rod protein FlgB
MSVYVPQFEMLRGLIQANHVRRQVIAQNVANVNTPGYKALGVQFEDVFAKQLRLRGESAAARVQPHIVKADGGAVRADGNNVDIDKEMGDLEKTNLLTATFNQLLSSRLSLMRTAIVGR